jgi:hypothetical protein
MILRALYALLILLGIGGLATGHVYGAWVIFVGAVAWYRSETHYRLRR